MMHGSRVEAVHWFIVGVGRGVTVVVAAVLGLVDYIVLDIVTHNYLRFRFSVLQFAKIQIIIEKTAKPREKLGNWE